MGALVHAGGAFERVRVRRYLVDGKESGKQDFVAQPFIVAGAEPGDPGTAHGFAQEESFCRWAAGTRHADRFARAIGTMKLAQSLEGTETGARAVRKVEATVSRLQGELEELSRETGLAMGSPEFLLQAALHRSVLEPPLFDPALLFDRVDDPGLPPVFGGKVFPVFGTIPTFGGFNDRASGALVFGLCTLHDKTFFRGAAAFLVGNATFVLADLGFDNRAASGIAL